MHGHLVYVVYVALSVTLPIAERVLLRRLASHIELPEDAGTVHPDDS